MTAADDIKEDGLTDLGGSPEIDKRKPPPADASRLLREVGPESEVRGGHEAPPD